MASRKPQIRVGRHPMVLKRLCSPKGLVGCGALAAEVVFSGAVSPFVCPFVFGKPDGLVVSSGTAVVSQPFCASECISNKEAEDPRQSLEICSRPEVVIALASVDKKGKGKVKRSAGASTSKVEDSPRPKRGRPPLGATTNA